MQIRSFDQCVVAAVGKVGFSELWRGFWLSYDRAVCRPPGSLPSHQSPFHRLALKSGSWPYFRQDWCFSYAYGWFPVVFLSVGCSDLGALNKGWCFPRPCQVRTALTAPWDVGLRVSFALARSEDHFTSGGSHSGIDMNSEFDCHHKEPNREYWGWLIPVYEADQRQSTLQNIPLVLMACQISSLLKIWRPPLQISDMVDHRLWVGASFL